MEATWPKDIKERELTHTLEEPTMQAADDAFAEYVVNWDEEQHKREGGNGGGKTDDNDKKYRNITVVVINEGEEEHREREEREGKLCVKEEGF
jgi:hypothetical protein